MDSGTLAEPPQCVTDLFDEKCGDVGCHAAGESQVDLVSPGVAGRLIDRMSASELECAGRTLVATDGSESLLLDKISENVPCGYPMPLSGEALTDAESMCLVQWVADLSAEDGGS